MLRRISGAGWAGGLIAAFSFEFNFKWLTEVVESTEIIDENHLST